MRAATCLVVAIAAWGCTGDPSGGSTPPPGQQPFVYEVRVSVPESITAVQAQGEGVAFELPSVVKLTRTWPTYDEALAIEPIEITFLAGDVAAHTGRVKPGVCASIPGQFYCPTSQMVKEGIGIFDLDHSDTAGTYLDFDVGTYTGLVCEGCGRGFASEP